MDIYFAPKIREGLEKKGWKVCVDDPPVPVEVDERQTLHVGVRLSMNGIQDETHINDHLADRFAQVCVIVCVWVCMCVCVCLWI